MTKLIQLAGIRITLNNWPILNGVDWTVEKQRHALIVGPSGSGKSTLLALMGGLLPATEGTIQYQGASYPPSQKSAQFRRNSFGFLFQDFHLIEHMTVADNLGLMQSVVSKPGPLPRIEELLEPLGLLERISTPVHVLSRGERQRVALARAFSNKPEVLLADEPTASLDPESASTTLAHLWNMCDALGTTAVVVSHDQGLIEDKRFDQVLKLSGGLLQPLNQAGGQP